MKKEFLLILIIFTLLLIIPSVFASLIKVEQKSSDETLIKDLGDPAIIELKVTNTGNKGTFVFDNIPGFFVMERKEVSLEENIPKTIQLRVYAKSDIDYKKYYYYIVLNYILHQIIKIYHYYFFCILSIHSFSSLRACFSVIVCTQIRLLEIALVILSKFFSIFSKDFPIE